MRGGRISAKPHLKVFLRQAALCIDKKGLEGLFLSAMASSTAFQFFSLTVLFAHCTSFSVDRLLPDEDADADAGELRKDIPEINSAAGLTLFQGDIVLPRSRSALKDEAYRWQFPIPFILGDSLDLNAKGVILRALEGFQLKSCVDFKPYNGEQSYIIFQKLEGCWSKIGDVKGGQNLSVGAGCDTKGIISHEILHALGRIHEQTRPDRDDYVEIWWDHVLPARTVILLDQCDFESADICGLVEKTSGDTNWIRKKSGQDHTLSGRCKDAGYFMYFNTSFGKRGETAILKSRILYPKRRNQCLQFFFKMTGSLWDRLFIQVVKDDGTGEVRRLVKAKTFQGDSDHNWKIAHVTLKNKKKFRYLFHGLKGNPDDSSGGIFIDDITLSETRCPSAVWLIRNFSHLLRTAPEDYAMLSPRFYSSEGYGFGITLYPRGQSDSASANYTRISFHLASGENDGVLEWPALNRQVTIKVLDQHTNLKERRSIERSFTTDESQVLPEKNNSSRWGKPSLLGKFDTSCKCHRSIDRGWSNFVSHAHLRRRNYLKNDDLIIFAEFDDLTHLKKTEHIFPEKQPVEQNDSLERKKRSASLEDWQSYLREQCDPNPCQNDGICVKLKGKTSCRCATSCLFFYTGVRCQVTHVHWNTLGLLAAGAVALTIVTISLLVRQ
uniref:meprin A subunit alpha isoform X5 n=1 Tax=Podarcis muralis TaxID=64176 RepID=UPI00109FC0F1|nr:meprin A subunit alpha isoform X5 [Podarcis muralis]